jgi:MscS family membrane protein
VAAKFEWREIVVEANAGQTDPLPSWNDGAVKRNIQAFVEAVTGPKSRDFVPLVHAHPRVERDGARIRFVGLATSSLDLEVFAYVHAPDMTEFLAIQEDLLLRILDLVAESGTSIAFPSQTTYFVRDTPVDGEQREHAEAHVRAWRDRGELPFPDFGPRQAADLQVAVEYPPEGSVLRNS